MGKGRRYNDEDVAAGLVALAANNGNVSATARALNIPTTTLRKWRDREPTDSVLVQQKKSDLLASFRLIAESATRIVSRSLQQLEDAEKPADVQIAVKLMTSAGIAVDKMRLLADESTAIVAVKAYAGFDPGDVT